MSADQYSKGFADAGRASAPAPMRGGNSRRGRVSASVQIPSRHGAAPPSSVFAERTANASIARRADPTKKPWARHAGQIGGACAAIGFIGGAASLAFQGNWAAIIVLPILLGLVGFIVFWLAAIVLDTFRGL